MPRIYPPEGGSFEVSQEYYDDYNRRMLAMMEEARPKAFEGLGQVYIVGVGGGLDDDTGQFREHFYNPPANYFTPNYPPIIATHYGQPE